MTTASQNFTIQCVKSQGVQGYMYRVPEVGEEFGYASARYSFHQLTISGADRSKVARVLKTKLVLENGMAFKLDGEQYGKDRILGTVRLMTVEHLEEIQAEVKQVRERQDSMYDFKSAVQAIHGNAVTAEKKAELLAMLEKLTVLD